VPHGNAPLTETGRLRLARCVVAGAGRGCQCTPGSARRVIDGVVRASCTAAAIAVDQLAWLQLFALDGELPPRNPSSCYRLLQTPPGSPAGNAAAGCTSLSAGPGPTRSVPRSRARGRHR
jgi:hypothetical protein